MRKVKEFFQRIFGMAKRSKKRPAPTPAPTGWYFSYGAPNPVIRADGISFDWTESPYVEPHYLMHPHGPLDSTKTLTIKFRIDVLSGNPDFQSTECTGDPTGTGKVSLFIRKNLNNTEKFNRAWAVGALRPKLTTGETTLSLPLNGQGWKFVYSETPQTNPAEWASLLANCTDIGMTFGGCGHAGHGAFVKGGSARMTIISVTVQ